MKPEPPPDPQAYAEIDSLLTELMGGEADFQARGPAGPGVQGWIAAGITSSMLFPCLQALPRNRPALDWLREAIRCCCAVEDQRRREGGDPDCWGTALCGQTAGELANLHACWTGRYPESVASAAELAETLHRELASIRRQAIEAGDRNDAVWGHFAALADALPAAERAPNAETWLSAVEERLAQTMPVDADQARALDDLRFGVALVRRRFSEPAEVRKPYRRVQAAPVQQVQRLPGQARRWSFEPAPTPLQMIGQWMILLIVCVVLPLLSIGWLMDAHLGGMLLVSLLLSAGLTAFLAGVGAWERVMDWLAAKHPRLHAVLRPVLKGAIMAMVAWGFWRFHP
jgi:hypothetical protein